MGSRIIELSPSEEERAKELHERSIIIDTLQSGPAVWNDRIFDLKRTMFDSGLPSWMVNERTRGLILEMLADDEQTRQRYVEDIRTSGVTAVNYTVGHRWKDISKSFRGAARSFADLIYKIDLFPTALTKAACAEDIMRAKKEGKMAIIPGFQDTAHLEDNMEVLELFHHMGIRIVQLTYNMGNSIGVGTTERYQDVAGLSYLGLQLVEKLNELKIVVDTGHCGYRTTLDAVDASKDPVAATHTACRTVYDYPRGKSDEEIRAIAEGGGYVGIYAVPFFYPKEEMTIHHLLDEIDHAVEIAGADHVGVGLDYGNQSGPYPKEVADLMYESMWSNEVITKYGASGFRAEHGVDPRLKVEGIETFQDWPNVTRGLVSRGYSDREIEGVLGGNFLRYFQRVVG
jgi:membrane dipeptidase